NRRQVAGRRIDDVQNLGHRGFLSLGFAKFGCALVKFLLQLGVSPPKFGYFVVERRGHLPAPSHPRPEHMIPRSAATFSREAPATRSPSRRERQVGTRVLARSDPLNPLRWPPIL